MAKNISDEQLISRCLKNLPEAWEEFFRRFIPVIKQAIRQRLRSCGRDDLGENLDVVWDIHQEIVVHLFRDKKLHQCADPTNIRSWLREMAYNQTIDWLRRHGARKRLPERVGTQSSLSLFAPLAGNSEITLEDVIPTPPESEPEVLEFLHKALRELGTIDNPKSFWALRLSVIAYLPLSPEELQELSLYLGKEVKQITHQVEGILLSLEDKEEKNCNALGQAVILWHEIRRLEATLQQKNRELGENVQALAEIQQQIDKKTRLREEYLKQGHTLLRPSNRDLAEMIGLPGEKADQISNILSRARQMLWEKTAKKSDF